jgi:hypothetical protein
MRDVWHIDEVLDAVRAAWVRNPQLPLGQLLAHATGEDPAQCADDLLLSRLESRHMTLPREADAG